MTMPGLTETLVLTAGLLTLGACSDSTAPTRGTPQGATEGAVRVTAATTGADLPTAAYRVSVDSGAGQTVPINGGVTIPGLSPGRHSVILYGVAVNCAVSGVNTRSVDVVAGDTAPVAFAVNCAASNHIAFVSNRDGDWHIYVTSAEGVIQLTTGAAVDANPAWSPDGTRIAFASNRDGNFEIYVMGAAGSNLTRLTTAPADDYDPAWSPDGKKIVFTSQRDGNPEIYVMEADGSSPAPLTDGAAGSDPTWSPDGMRIAFVSHRDGNKGQIYVMNADGSHITRLTEDLAEDCEPAWSPAGGRIAFVSGCTSGLFPDGYGSSIYLMNADGSNRMLLTGGPGDVPQARFPSWSSDGTAIAFASPAACRLADADGCHWWWPYGIFVVRIDGTSVASPVAYDDSSSAVDPSWRR